MVNREGSSNQTRRDPHLNLTIDRRVELLAREPEVEEALKTYAKTKIVHIPFETFVKNNLAEDLIKKPEQTLAAVKNALRKRFEFLDPSLQLDEDEPYVLIEPFASQVKETAELTADDEGELVFVAGRVREVKPPKPVPVAKKLICKACGAKVVYEDRQPRRCPRCGESKLAVETEYDTVQTLKLDHIFVIFGHCSLGSETGSL